MLVRWLHLIAGIARVAPSFCFIRLDNPIALPAPGSDNAKQGAGRALGRGIGAVSMVGSWIVYDLLCKSPLGNTTHMTDQDRAVIAAWVKDGPKRREVPQTCGSKLVIFHVTILRTLVAVSGPPVCGREAGARAVLPVPMPCLRACFPDRVSVVGWASSPPP